ncbi:MULTISPECIES: LysR family transcriptional regulator [unclassified Microbacterium]|uniref:LysR family transcriptional regulator n=1 Tax=unclassified Microbacterium TaxID=2609290 RepID=UPI0036512AD0
MNIPIEHLRVVVTVARCASFSDAARDLRITQPAVSRTIQTVEATVGTALFHRTTRRVELTADGAEFVAVAVEILEGYAAGLKRFTAFQSADQGSLRVAALPVLAGGWLTPVLAGFLTAHPAVQLHLSTGSATRILDSVRAGDADVAVTEWPTDITGLSATPLAKDPLRAAIRSDHPLAGRDRVTWHDIAEHPFIQLAEGTSVRRLTDDGFRRAGATPRTSITADATIAVIAMVSAGLGVTAFPESSKPLLHPSQHVNFVPLDGPEISRQLAVVTAQSPKPSAVARSFVAEITHASASNRP